MSEKHLDDQIKQHITQAFDDYSENGSSADEGWLLLREKFPEKQRGRVIGTWFWRSMAAAVILLFGGLGFWIVTSQDEPVHIAIHQPKVQQPSYRSVDSVKISSPITPESVAYPPPANKAYASVRSSTKVPSSYPDDNNPLLSEAIKEQPVVNADDTEPAKTGILVTPVLPAQQFDPSTQNQPVLAQQQPDVTKRDSLPVVSKRPQMADLFAAEQNQTKIKPRENNKAADNKRVLFSIYAGSYFNFAEGSKSQVNAGAGFSSDIKLAGRLKLSTGVAIARNTLSYDRQPMQANILSDAVNANKLAGAATVENTVAKSGFAFTQVKVAATPVVSGYNVSLTGLDIPINLKYEFSSLKSDSYVSAGLSSGTFISENYRYQYSNSANLSLASPQEVNEATTSRSFSRFDFARTLNLSVGTGFQINKSNRLIIEPFFKYPLDGLGSQQIRFGSGGVNLKLKFQSQKR